jgi:hypothetical protein
MARTITEPPPVAAPAVGPPRGRGRVAALTASALLVVVFFSSQVPSLRAGALNGDLGIQYFLSGETARGAVPLLDFEHTWNAGSWYFSALLYRLAGGDPSGWLFLWGVVFGPMLAGLAVVAVAWRLRLESAEILALVGGWFALSHVVHLKYSIPTLWVLALLPVGRGAREPAASSLRALAAGVTFLAHVELAVLLGAGTALYDLFGARGLPLRTRVRRAAMVPAGLVVAFAVQAAVYGRLGLPAAELTRQLLLAPAVTVEGANFGYPLFAPVSFRPKLFPASLVVAFVPMIWRRLSAPTRLVAFLHLSQALVAIRRPDANHVDAAVTLLGVLAVLAALDLARDRRPLAWARAALPIRAGLFAAGALWFAVAMAAGFRVAHLGAIVLLTLVVLGAVAAARVADWTEASAGALAAALLLVAAGVVNSGADRLRAGDDDSQGRAIAAAVAGPLRDCTGGDPRVWVVPSPLTLYSHLGLENPTPHAAFWYGFASATGRVGAALDDGSVPAILQVGTWPGAFAPLVPQIEARYTACATVPVEQTGDLVTIWTRAG